jgi:hypothetical protein
MHGLTVSKLHWTKGVEEAKWGQSLCINIVCVWSIPCACKNYRVSQIPLPTYQIWGNRGPCEAWSDYNNVKAIIRIKNKETSPLGYDKSASLRKGSFVLNLWHPLLSLPHPTHIPFPDYNSNQEDSSFGIKKWKDPSSPTQAISIRHDYESNDNFPIK